MPISWFLFAVITVIGAVTYNVSVKAAGDHINPFVFSVALTVVGLVGHLACLALYKFYFHQDITLQADKKGLWLAVMAGVGIVLIDLGFFFAVKTGGLFASNLFWVIGSLSLTAIASYFIFQETFTMTKMLGIVFGMISVLLLTRP